MNEEQREIFFDLLTKKAVYGLNEAEQLQLDTLDDGSAELEFASLEMTAAAINMAGLELLEPMPANLFSKIMAESETYVGDQNAKTIAWPPSPKTVETVDDEPARGSIGSWFGWFGWAAAAAAVIVLALNVWFTRVQPTEIANVKPPVETPKTLTTAELRDEMMRSAGDVIKATWAAGNVKDITTMVGDVVWSDQKQAGYMMLKGLPANDKTKETYQLWIFDKTQDKATPIDGGTFDVTSNGEVVIPINAKLKAQGPEMFAITVEKPGGVVVSKRGKIAAIAKVETQPHQGA